MIFENYAKYYDLLYKDKDYAGEVEYVDSLIKKRLKAADINILDIGCGTGVHAGFLAKKGYHVTGIDLSADMIRVANEKQIPNANFQVQNATDFKLENKFDVILSLFHVVSYQNANQDINSMFSRVSQHLQPGGLFIFDFWYGPAVLSLLPETRVKRLEDSEAKIYRLAEPDVYQDRNVVDVKYELIIYNKATKQADFINESHPMRYLFLPELDVYLENAGLKAVNYEEWITGDKPSNNSWGVTCIASKNT